MDRRGPGNETSYGNGGIIQREAVHPYPFPRHITDIFRILSNHSIDVRYRPGALFSNVIPLWAYWHHSSPKRFRRIVSEYASLIEYCTIDHEAMFKATSAQNLIRRSGWLQAFRTMNTFKSALVEAEDARDRFGVTFDRIEGDHLHEMEPFLSDRIVGAIHWTNSWSVVDPGALVQSYADGFVAHGGHIKHAEVLSIEPIEGGVNGWRVRTKHGTEEFYDLVLATGPWSPTWYKSLGYRIPMFIQRGYHMHYTGYNNAALNYAIQDFERGYVISPKKAGIRLTTGAELNNIDAPLRLRQLEAAEKIAREFFPIGDRKEKKVWVGGRPCISDMKPVIGSGHLHSNLWFAFGHAHQGFTMGPTTGRLLAQMMDREKTAIDMTPFRANRFS
jgi:D-amino-acid dehydrogenase